MRGRNRRVRARGIGFGLGEALAATREEGCGRALGAQFRVDEWQGSLRPEFQIERIGSSRDGSGQPRECCITCEHAALPGEAGRSGPSPCRAQNRSQCSFLQPRSTRSTGGMSTIAQVLASGQRTVLVASSAPNTLATVRERIPLDAFTQSTVACVGRACARCGAERAAASRVAVVEWDVAAEVIGRTDTATHLIVVDPPFRRSHVAFLHKVAIAGAIIHSATETRRGGTPHGCFATRCTTLCDGLPVSSDARRAAGGGRAVSAGKPDSVEEAHVVLTFADCARRPRSLRSLGSNGAPGERIN